MVSASVGRLRPNHIYEDSARVLLAYMGSSWKLSHLRPSSSVTLRVVLEPLKMSTAMSPGAVRNRMKKRGSSAGELAG
jgi:hypothetical protein